ncbi:DUF397 domain-containing protein [Streptomyces bluensis]|uniref:DUF397 domain-containing protein n=1 Tax=Streptomyces bluensis TaxID=33897 RepID=A0ABW6UU71_9ACTN
MMAAPGRDIGDRPWVKSSYSGGAGSDCVEVAFGTGETVGVRDSKVVPGPLLTVGGEAFAVFLNGVRRGELDRMA